MALLAQVSTQKLITNTIQSDFVSVNDKYGTPTTITTGYLAFLTSSSLESYALALTPIITGSISSLGLIYSDNLTADAGSLYISSLYLGNLGGTTSGNLTTDSTASNLFWNGSQLMTNRVKIVVSTLGADTMYINTTDIAIRFIVNGSNCPQDILLPDISAAGDGWNVKIQQPGGFFNSLSVYDFSSNVVFTVNSGQLYDVVTDGTTWYYTYSTQ